MRTIVNRSFICAFIGIALLTSGCVGVAPVPSFSNKPEHGKVIKPSEVAFIVPGKTGREEIVQRLGRDFREDWQKRVMAYSWELPGGQGLGWWCIVSPFGSAGDKGEFEWSRWRALFLAFDERDIVVGKKFVHLSGGKSLDEQLERWGKSSVRAPN